MYNQSRRRFGAIEIIIIINVIFFIPWMVYFLARIPHLLYLESFFLNLNINNPNGYLSINDGAVWQLLTAMFIHGGLGHLIFNMYGLYIFGKPLEQKWGSARFTFFYLTTGVLANVASAIFYVITDSKVSLIGASGAIFGVLLAFGGYFPNVRVLLFFFIPLKVKWAILIFAVVELAFEITNTVNGIAHITHLFGFLFAFLYLLIIFKINPIQKMFFPKDDDYIIY
ncbi:MAG TPA: rhomboid family intramembrane serine protease [Spirochaetota bacterium]|jgi:membrane associated rhomboid family serine protease|nr:MAG: Rhomboid protease GluP [Spirochaetes bacterium ADurb.Bin133]HNZ28063.1 rhomboid family intramembrane serine protease [Spirochaetota bacterium]HOF02278.1 rhomboid family intramembrane serine protease [Spirochaetota bacterium]HOS34086.1 rhomboid family intramembrane serine protease [Spirochaetota bacterium]HOS56961.1 rhomboid family intramembrane serine protease [Spirochaetota bacterium]